MAKIEPEGKECTSASKQATLQQAVFEEGEGRPNPFLSSVHVRRERGSGGEGDGTEDNLTNSR